MVQLTEGNGRIKQNAICVLKDNIYNQHCEVFYHYTTATKATAAQKIKHFTGEIQQHHACARCKEGYEWPIDDDGNVSEYTCEPEYIENSWVVNVDTRWLMGGATAIGSFLILTTARIYLQKSWKNNGTNQDVDIDIDRMTN